MKIFFAFLLISQIAFADPLVKQLSVEEAKQYKHVVIQNAKAFSISELTVKVKETVAFINLDPIVHNVFSKTGGQDFDLKVQPSNSASAVTFLTPGKVHVFCAIHPSMKLIITVTDENGEIPVSKDPVPKK